MGAPSTPQAPPKTPDFRRSILGEDVCPWVLVSDGIWGDIECDLGSHWWKAGGQHWRRLGKLRQPTTMRRDTQLSANCLVFDRCESEVRSVSTIVGPQPSSAKTSCFGRRRLGNVHPSMRSASQPGSPPSPREPASHSIRCGRPLGKATTKNLSASWNG